LSGEIWYEIDDIQDLDIATAMFADTDEERYMAYICRYGGYWRYPQMLDYCYLVNPYFPPQKLLDEIRASFDTLIREYPSGMKVNSLLASKNFGVKEDFIVVGNGAAELIKALMEGYAGTLGNILPTFEEYPNRLSKEHLVQYVPDSEDFHYSAEDVKNYFKDKDIDTLLLINPDNPSGNYIPFDELLGLIQWTKEKGWRFVVDESFVDFADVEGETSLLDNAILAENPHLFVVKSISKSYGVPGLRLGIMASGNREIMAQIKKDVAIWNINSFGEFYMQIYEKYKNDYEEGCRYFREERKIFRQELEEISYLKVFDSQANYFLCEIIDKFKPRELAMKLLRKNILIKDCGGKAAMKGRNLIRLAVRDRKDNSYLVEQLKKL
ncbi:MAG: histidinol-phosphate aminotransferase family protein, partial [Alistipes sp.]|nr:histidinol-phosphate aminotransferase family protein [Candidatus Minthomonas equi]